jgi:type II secretory pathway pseudopilin PulG
MYRLKKLILDRQPQGIGLVEVILVIAIAGFMITLAISGISSSGRSSFDDGMKQVLNDLRQVQNEAASGQAIGTVPGGSELFGKGVGFATKADEVPAGSFAFQGSGLDSVGVDSRKYFALRTTGTDTLTELTPASRGAYPGSVALKSIEVVPNAGGNVVTYSKGTLVFTGGGANSGNVLPYFFPNYGAADPSPASGVGTVASYAQPQDSKVTLTYVGRSNTGYTAKIEINTATGTMELRQ